MRRIPIPRLSDRWTLHLPAEAGRLANGRGLPLSLPPFGCVSAAEKISAAVENLPFHHLNLSERFVADDRATGRRG